MDISKLRPAANNVIVKILNADRTKVFEKSVTRNDGTSTKLIVSTDLRIFKDEHGTEYMRSLEEEDNDRNTYFVRTGTIVSVGEKVKRIMRGDLAIIDYTIDNRDDLVVGTDRDGKYVSVCGVTAYYQEDIIENAQRNSPRDQVVAFKGEITRLTDIIAVIRHSRIYSINPYVIISQARAVEAVRTASGIEYEKKEEVICRRVISAFDGSLMEGEQVLVKDADCFDIVLEEYGTMSGCFEGDILAKYT